MQDPRETGGNIFFFIFFLKNLSRHEQLKQEEKMMEDQIKVNAEAVESLIRILSK